MTEAATVEPVQDLIAARSLSKSFGASVALDGFDFELRRGEINALIGENGAGKSTFIKMLAGLHGADGGELVVSAAVRLAFIHQDLGLIPGLSVADNIALGGVYPRRLRLIDWGSTRREATATLDLLGVEIDPAADIETLSMAERALVAIARALRIDANVLVLDEPTATLPGRDVDRLFSVLRRLRDEGMGIIYVSHRLREVLSLADRVTVVRDGSTRFVGPAADLTERRLIELMTGLPADERKLGTARAGGETILKLHDLDAAGAASVDLEVKAGQSASAAPFSGWSTAACR
jgi:ribose transport system ATP-binding protein